MDSNPEPLLEYSTTFHLSTPRVSGPSTAAGWTPAHVSPHFGAVDEVAYKTIAWGSRATHPESWMFRPVCYSASRRIEIVREILTL